ncbi:Stomatin-1 [Portunus trituberculatus]|uniref:Stomatin-1 n=1 Tax=Portunus trituberculatus TaxID=210409 RepID=A0A5B7DH19_PORTR|nr:Stomatin-1 [Portunus trituberculatus]
MYLDSPPVLSPFLPLRRGQILSRDSVTVAVDAVVYYKIFRPVHCVTVVSDFRLLTVLVTQVLSRDSVTVAVDAVVYYKIFSPINSVTVISDYR